MKRDFVRPPLVPFSPTNVADLCRQAIRLFQSQLQQRQVELTFDVDSSLEADLPQAVIQDVLVRMLEDAITHMESGGQLDVTVVAGPRVLEIEVADSRSTLDRDASQSGKLTADTAVTHARKQGMLLETLLCPQGGIARTLIIPWADQRDKSRRLAA